jgi:hypothetical protein
MISRPIAMAATTKAASRGFFMHGWYPSKDGPARASG